MIFYRNASGKCPIEEFVEDLPSEDAKEVIQYVAPDDFKNIDGMRDQ